jgi:hypothetical protein
MVLYPINSPASQSAISTGFLPAFEAVERKQKQAAEAWWLIAQPDHAALSGDLAASISHTTFPRSDREVLEAIALHDAGWVQFDGGTVYSQGTVSRGAAIPVEKASRPLSFLDMSPTQFLRAWISSIERAQQSSAIGGILVSHHFSRIAQSRLQTGNDSAEDSRSLNTFLCAETERREFLSRATQRSAQDVGSLVDVLQFCDLLSLYLCCGAQENIEFPQKFNGCTIRLRREGNLCRTEPSIFAAGVSLAVRARRYPPSGQDGEATALPFLLI